MAYNQMAEMFSEKAAVPWWEGSPTWTRFLQVYSDIADATPVDDAFQLTSLAGKLPSLQGYKRRTQLEILRVVVRDMLALPADADGLERCKNGWFRWRFGVR